MSAPVALRAAARALRDLRAARGVEALRAAVAALDPATRQIIARTWQLAARDKQLRPKDCAQIWLILAGRGFGKSRAGAEWVVDEHEERGPYGGTLIGKDLGDVRVHKPQLLHLLDRVEHGGVVPVAEGLRDLRERVPAPPAAHEHRDVARERDHLPAVLGDQVRDAHAEPERDGMLDACDVEHDRLHRGRTGLDAHRHLGGPKSSDEAEHAGGARSADPGRPISLAGHHHVFVGSTAEGATVRALGVRGVGAADEREDGGWLHDPEE